MRQGADDGLAPLAKRLAHRIETDGPMPFSQWMEACLYDERDGYYNRPGRKTGPGRDADFVTPPTLHPFFGEAVARELHAAWARIGRPDPYVVHEYGGGEGGLARNALAAADRFDPDWARIVEWVHVERSRTHRDAMLRAPADPRIRVAPDVSATSTPDGGTPHAVVAIEVVDAIPFDILEAAGDAGPPSAQPIHVGFEEGRFVEVYGSPRELALWGRQEHPPLVPGQRILDQSRARHWLEGVLDAGPRDVLLIDYGDTSRRLWTRDRMDGTVRGYRRQSLVESVLEAPGEVDITGSVDFDQVWDPDVLRSLAEGTTFESLERFLLRHGVLEALNATDRSTREGASDYLRLRQLLLPSGLGGQFKVHHTRLKERRDERSVPRPS